MVLASHIIIAGLLGAKTGNYFLAASVGFISHYILDAIPHWDYLPQEFEKEAKKGNLGFMKNKTFWREMAKVALDILMGFSLLFVLMFVSMKTRISVNIAPAFIAGLFGILPDPLDLLYWMTNWKIIKWNFDIQYFAHYLIHEKKPRFWLGILTQILTIAVVFSTFYKPWE